MASRCHGWVNSTHNEKLPQDQDPSLKADSSLKICLGVLKHLSIISVDRIVSWKDMINSEAIVLVIGQVKVSPSSEVPDHYSGSITN